MILDFLGWDSLSVAEQAAVVFYVAIGAIGGFLVAMGLLAIFVGPPVPSRAKPKPKKKKAKARRKRGR